MKWTFLKHNRETLESPFQSRLSRLHALGTEHDGRPTAKIESKVSKFFENQEFDLDNVGFKPGKEAETYLRLISEYVRNKKGKPKVKFYSQNDDLTSR